MFTSKFRFPQPEILVKVVRDGAEKKRRIWFDAESQFLQPTREVRHCG